MKLTNRNLEFGLQGDDVRELQRELTATGHEVPEAERLEGVFGAGTQQAVLALQNQERLPATALVDKRTADALERIYQLARPRTLHGRVLNPDASAAAGLVVQLLDRRLEDAAAFMETKTDDSGSYWFTYTARQREVPDPSRLALCVVVVLPGEREPIKSDLLYAPGVDETVDFHLPGETRTPSAYELLGASLRPVLGDVNPADLSEEQVTYVAQVSGTDRERVARYRQSAGLAHALDIPQDIAFVLSRGDAPATREGMLNSTQARILAAVNQALVDKQIDEAAARRMASFVQTRLAERQIDHVLRVSGDDEPASLGRLLVTIPAAYQLRTKTPRTFARAAIKHGLEARDLWERAAEARLPKQDIATLKVVFALQDLTQGHLPFMADLHQRRTDGANSSIAFLTSLRPREWLELAYTHGAPVGSSLSIGDYAQQLEQNLEDRYPTRVLAQRLGQGDLKLAAFPTDAVVKFLNAYPEFDLTTMHVEPFLYEHDRDNEQLSGALLKMQSFQGLTGNWREAGVLLNRGFSSPSAIARYGQEQFQDFVGDAIPRARAGRIYSRALDTLAATLAVATQYSPRFSPLGLTVLPTTVASDETLQKYASLRTLFGDLDYCECRHCRSVLSPAAYFVDLLQFLSKEDLTSGRSPLDVLLKHRPDLVDLDLSCENTNIEIPYVDLVLELLENDVVCPLDVTVPASLDVKAALAKGEVPKAIEEMLRSTAVAAGESLTVEQTVSSQPGWSGRSDWSISDGSRRWWLQHRERELLEGGGLGLMTASVPGVTNIDAAVQGLRNGTLDTQLAQYLAPEPNLPFYGQPAISAGVSPDPAARPTWVVQYVRAVAIRITMHTPYGIMEFLPLDSLDGKPISTEQRPTAQLQRIAAGLYSSDPSQNKTALEALGLPDLSYELKDDTTNGWMEARHENQVKFSLQPDQLTLLALTYQNSARTRDLMAYPENRNPLAYDRLAAVPFPWSLPFNLWLEENRAFLQSLGVTRRHLMELARPHSAWTDDDLALEVLGLSSQEAGLIAPKQPQNEPWKFWGLSDTKKEIFDHALGKPRSGIWLEILEHVSMLLQQSGLSFRELLNLIQSDYIKAIDPQLKITAPDECKPSAMTLAGLNRDHLDRIHRFVRLWRKLGWSMRDLDRAIVAFWPASPPAPPPDIVPDTFAQLSLIQRLVERLGLPAQTIISWLVGIDTRPIVDHTQEGSPEVPSLYAALFLRPALHHPPDADLNLNAAGTELDYIKTGVAAKLVTDKTVLIGSALRIKPTDVTRLVDPASKLKIDDELNLANLARAFSVSSLAHALGLTIEDYVRLVAITGINPFVPFMLHPVLIPVPPEGLRILVLLEVLKFADCVDFIRQSSFDLDELEYLLRQKIHVGSTFAQIEQTHSQFLAQLRTAYKQGPVLAQASAENVATQLGRLGWYPELTSSAVGEAGLSYQARAEITISPKLSSSPQILAGLRDKFYYVEKKAPSQDALLGCQWPVTNRDFQDLGKIITSGNWVDLLKQEYNKTLGKQAAALHKQMQCFSLPSFRVDASATWPSPLPEIPVEFLSRLSFDTTSQEVVWTGWMSLDELKELKGKGALSVFSSEFDTLRGKALAYKQRPDGNAFLSEAVALDVLREPALDVRYRTVLQRLLSYFASEPSSAEHQGVAALFASTYGLDASSGERLLDHLKDTSGQKTALQVLTEAAFVESDDKTPPDDTTFPEQFAVLRRYHKMSLMVQKLKLRPAELAWLTDGQFAVLDAPLLPIVQTNFGSSFDAWQQTVLLVRLRDVLADGSSVISQLNSKLGDKNAKKDDMYAILGQAFEKLSVSEVAAAAGPTLLKMTWSKVQSAQNDYREPRRLFELAEFLHVLELMGITVKDVKSLTEPVVDQGSAQTARRLLQGQFDAETLAQRLRPISDRLRERQRDALIAYLVDQHGLRDADALFDHLLIDVQMGACMTTSRIKQAITAVQLFIERCLMNLEQPAVLPSQIAKARWRWMEHYRVWEANRKVFLYPENWIEPELRDDKSEIFRSLESDLLENELNHDQAVTAFHKYLEKLIEISHLTVVSMYEEHRTAGEPRTIVHIVARDGEKPYRHFYRQWRISSKDATTWTPWEEITLQVNGDHALVFVNHGRVYLAWPVISRVAKAKTRDDDTPVNYWQVGLNMGRRTTAGWISIKSSRNSLPDQEALKDRDERTSFAFRILPTPQTTVIECYCARYADRSISPAPLADADVPSVGIASSTISVSVVGRVFARYTDGNGQKQYSPIVGASVNLYRQDILSQDYRRCWTRAGGEYGVNCRLDPKHMWSQTVDLIANVQNDDQKYTSDSVEATIQLKQDADGQYLASYTLFRDICFDLTQPPQTSMIERDVVLSLVGKFIIKADEEIQTVQESGGNLVPAVDTEHFSSIFRRKKNPQFLDLRIGFEKQPISGVLLKPVDPGFTLAMAAQSGSSALSMWAYRGETAQLAIQETSPGVFRLLIDGHNHAEAIAATVFAGDVEDASDLGRTIGPPLGGVDTMFVDTSRSSTDQGINYDWSVPYASYNWEVFFHIPLLAATQLSKAMRFQEAERWFHLIFDPTTSEPGDESQRYWRFRPFRMAGQGRSIEELLGLLAKQASGVSLTKAEATLCDEITTQIEIMRSQPFQPHAIARNRIRAYQFAIVLKYLDNLIAWADQLFRQDTTESINMATILYVRAARLLGRKPESIPAQAKQAVITYRALYGKWDDFSNAWLGLEGLVESLLKWLEWLKEHGVVGSGGTGELDQKIKQTLEQLGSLGAPYFCVPNNDKLLDYWATIERRLLDIRHCKNIDGIERPLPLFDLPIDPALLVKAAAAGLDISAILADLNAPLPYYRYSIMLQKALELTGELKAMGASLLSVLEKKDAEELALLRSKQEIELLKKVNDVRQQQVKDAQANIAALRGTRLSVFERYKHYQMLLGKTNVPYPVEQSAVPPESSNLSLAADPGSLGLSRAELKQIVLQGLAQQVTNQEGLASTLSGLLHALPNSVYGPLVAQLEIGGSHLGYAAGAIASYLKARASLVTFAASQVSLLGSHQRRRDDWVHLSNLAAKEIEQIDKQILASQIRIDIATNELANHQTQIENAEKADAFMHSKYTNQQLYQWMVGQVSGVYFRTYQLAYDVAKKAERAFRSELGLSDSSYVSYGYWDSLKKGLLAGEHLFFDLKRMDIAYLDKNKREYEITKHVSLLSLSPDALLQLRQTGRCEVSIPEAAFDLDFPGHYMRRIKSVGVSIPCVTGPYTGVNCTLTLLKSWRRNDSLLRNGKYERDAQSDDPRFTDYFGSIQSIVTSSGQNDSGLFETNLRDERYLPFEGAGAISTWRIELPDQFRQFDYDTISDVIMHLRYTAREGGELLRTGAVQSLGAAIQGAEAAGTTRLFSIRQEFPNEWARFKSADTSKSRAELSLKLRAEHYPFWSQGRLKSVQQVDIFASCAQSTLKVFDNASSPAGTEALKRDPTRGMGNLFVGKLSGNPGGIMPSAKPDGELKLYFDTTTLADLWLAVTWGG